VYWHSSWSLHNTLCTEWNGEKRKQRQHFVLLNLSCLCYVLTLSCLYYVVCCAMGNVWAKLRMTKSFQNIAEQSGLLKVQCITYLYFTIQKQLFQENSQSAIVYLVQVIYYLHVWPWICLSLLSSERMIGSKDYGFHHFKFIFTLQKSLSKSSPWVWYVLDFVLFISSLFFSPVQDCQSKSHKEERERMPQD